MNKRAFPFLVLLVLCACNPYVVTPTSPAVTASPLPSVTPTPMAMATPAASATAQTAEVLAASLNVREGPGTEYPAKEEHLFAGQGVTILEYSGDWVRIEKPDGWVWRGCVSDNPDRLLCQAKESE